jgi:hypothetical protein
MSDDEPPVASTAKEEATDDVALAALAEEGSLELPPPLVSTNEEQIADDVALAPESPSKTPPPLTFPKDERGMLASKEKVVMDDVALAPEGSSEIPPLLAFPKVEGAMDSVAQPPEGPSEVTPEFDSPKEEGDMGDVAVATEICSEAPLQLMSMSEGALDGTASAPEGSSELILPPLASTHEGYVDIEALAPNGPTGMPPLLVCCKHLVRPNGVIVGSEISAKTRSTYPTLLSTIPLAPTPFIASLDGRLPVSHAETHQFIESFGAVLQEMRIGKGQRVALVLPNGPELAMAILAVSNWTGCVPLSATGAINELEGEYFVGSCVVLPCVETIFLDCQCTNNMSHHFVRLFILCWQLSADLLRCGPRLIIGPYSSGPLPVSSNNAPAIVEDGSNAMAALAKTTHVLQGDTQRDWTVHSHVKQVAEKLHISFAGLVPDPEKAGPFKLVIPVGRKIKTALVYEELPMIPDSIAEPEQEIEFNIVPNSAPDEALVLFTSGTTGNKKVVPHCMGDLLTAATVIALSWQLVPTDVNCNLMPLL